MTSAPTRIDLAGGTIDIWPLYLFHPGAQTLNAAISLRATARLESREDGTLIAVPVSHQDSSLLGNLAAARALVIRPPLAPAAARGSRCELLRLPE